MNKSIDNPPVTDNASGNMTGTITFLHNGTVDNFQSFRVIRNLLSEMTYLIGVVAQPGKAYEIILVVPGDEPLTGTYTIGSNKVTAYLNVGESPQLIAVSGQIEIQNQTPIGKITGSAKFVTQVYNEMHYAVDANFDISRTAAGAERTS